MTFGNTASETKKYCIQNNFAILLIKQRWNKWIQIMLYLLRLKWVCIKIISIVIFRTLCKIWIQLIHIKDKDKGQVFDEERELLPAKSIHSPLYIQTYICSVEILFVWILKFYLHNVAFSATEKWAWNRRYSVSWNLWKANTHKLYVVILFLLKICSWLGYIYCKLIFWQFL